MKKVLLRIATAALYLTTFSFLYGYENGDVISWKASDTEAEARLGANKGDFSFEYIVDKLAKEKITGTLVIDKTVNLNRDIKIPASIDVIFRRGNQIVLNGHTLAINGSISAGLFQIFDISAKGGKVCGNSKIGAIYPQWWGACDDSSKDASKAFQAAIDFAKQSSFSRTIQLNGKFLITKSLNATKTKGIKFIGEGGKNQQCTVYAHTGNALFDCTGSSHMGFKGFYIRFKSNSKISAKPSNCAILLASGKDRGATECLYNEISYMYIEMYRKEMKGKFGTVGLCCIGSEENTIMSNQLYCDTPIIITAYNNLIKGEVTSRYAAINSAHSAGVNSFCGENMLVAWNYRSYNLILNGVNTVSLGNIYFGVCDWNGEKGKIKSGIQLNTNVDILTGNIKMEAKTSLIDINPGAVVSCVDLRTELGGTRNIGNKKCGIVNILGNRYNIKLNDFNLHISYPAFEGLGGWPHPAKSIFMLANKPNPGCYIELNNARIVSNQTSTHMAEILPALIASRTNNVEMAFRDKVFHFSSKKGKK